MKASLVALSLVVVAGVVIPGSPARADGVVAGTVSNDRAELVEDIEVSVCQVGGACAYTTTDVNGDYSTSVPDGTYQVRFRDPTGLQSM